MDDTSVDYAFYTESEWGQLIGVMEAHLLLAVGENYFVAYGVGYYLNKTQLQSHGLYVDEVHDEASLHALDTWYKDILMMVWQPIHLFTAGFMLFFTSILSLSCSCFDAIIDHTKSQVYYHATLILCSIGILLLAFVAPFARFLNLLTRIFISPVETQILRGVEAGLHAEAEIELGENNPLVNEVNKLFAEYLNEKKRVPRDAGFFSYLQPCPDSDENQSLRFF